jgi:undecaprenyl-diphosphatase
MNIVEGLDALLLGLTDGLTGVRSRLVHMTNPDSVFEIVIQLVAIPAILSFYFGKLWSMPTNLPSDRATPRFMAGILLAFFPAAIFGASDHTIINTVIL